MRASRTVENEDHHRAGARHRLGDPARLPAARARAARSRSTRWSPRATSTRSTSCRQAPLPAAAGFAAQLRRQGPAHRVGRRSSPSSRRSPTATPAAAARSRSLRHGRRHGRRRDAGQGMDRRASGPGAHPEDDAAGAGRHEHGRAQGLLRHRMRAASATGSARPTAPIPGRRSVPHRVGRRRRASSPTSPRSASRRPIRSTGVDPGERRAGRRAGKQGRDDRRHALARRNTSNEHIRGAVLAVVPREEPEGSRLRRQEGRLSAP